MKTIPFLIIFVVVSLLSSYSQESTIKILQYNLLRYGLYDENCTNTNNSVEQKNEYLKTIICYTNPDIFAVNEITSDSMYHDWLLNNVFSDINSNCSTQKFGRGYVRGSYLTSQIYYNKNKFTLVKSEEIKSNPRNILVYKFYYNSPDIASGDTVFFKYFLTHFKAGNTSQALRNSTANAIMQYLRYRNSTENYILSGDLNLYSNTENAYATLTNYPITEHSFIDPVSAGEWHNNENFKDYHTQSTRKFSDNCASYGGLDDRFDFILYSKAIKNNSNKMKFQIFKIIGQDGKHFNKSINYEGNSSVPNNVLNAIYNCSDHLPIYAEFKITQTKPSLIQQTQTLNFKITKITNNQIIISKNNNENNLDKIQISIFDILGKKHFTKIEKHNNNYFISTENLHKGIYVLNIKTKSKFYKTIKFIKN